ncbi:hypothetical protein ACFYMW_40455 [Streptomyces sp. NPDC006692]|uniref:hypothetical protein n=1 Tax=unclassified Streptomyces TaxID=2593676 RepID=UPI0036B7FFA4
MDIQALAILAEEFSYAWDGKEDGWILIGDPENPLIFNRNNRQALVIEDNDVNAFVIEKMRKSGVNHFLDAPPPQG